MGHALRLGREFWKLWAAVAVSNASSGILTAVVPLLALTVTVTDSSAAVGAVAAARWAPWIVFSIVAGSFADRFDRRTLMRNMQAARLAMLMLLAGAIIVEQLNIWSLFAIAFALGVVEVVYGTAAEAFLPSVVRSDRLVTANGRLFVAELTANRLVGPFVGGLLFAVGQVVPVLLTVALIVAAVGMLQFLRGYGAPGGTGPRLSLIAQAREGIYWLVGNRLLRILSLGIALLNLAISATGAMLVVLVLRELDGTSTTYGVLLAGSAVGGVAGATTVARIGRIVGRGNAIVASLLLGGGILALLAAVQGFALTLALLVVSGFFGTIGNVLVRSLRQEISPPEMLGRISASFRFISYSTLPIGALLGGLVTDAFGVRTVYLVGGVLVTLAGVALAPLLVGRRTPPAGMGV